MIMARLKMTTDYYCETCDKTIENNREKISKHSVECSGALLGDSEDE